MSRLYCRLPDGLGPSGLAYLLLFSNLLNYLDRQLFLSLFPLFRLRFSLPDLTLGLLASSFTAVYVLVAPFAGILIRSLSPGALISGGILTFSAGMAITGLATDLRILFAGRMLTGAGEAVLTTLAPVFLMNRNFARIQGTGTGLGIFYAAIPVGSAMGFALGAIFPRTWDFQYALLIPVLPGILLSYLVYRSFEGTRDDEIYFKGKGRVREGFFKKSVLLSFFVQSAITFVLGGMAAWISVYLTRVKGMGLSRANFFSSGALFVGGLSGILLGGILLDRERREESGAWGFRTTFGGLLLGAAGIIIVLAAPANGWLMQGLILATFGLFLGTVPVNCLILTRNPPLVSAPLMGLSLLISHVFGDLPSPSLIGWASQKSSLDHSLGFFLLVPVFSAMMAVFLYRKV
ncbi:MAG: MFS transporter [Leptospirillum sp.]